MNQYDKQCRFTSLIHEPELSGSVAIVLGWWYRVRHTDCVGEITDLGHCMLQEVHGRTLCLMTIGGTLFVDAVETFELRNCEE